MKRRLVGVAAILLAGCAAVVPAYGQVVHAAGPLPSFEVATIKPAHPGGPIAWPPPNIVRSFGGTARDLVRIAYGLPPGPAEARVFGGPSWIDSNHYDVEGKIPEALFAEMQKLPPQQQGRQRSLMLQALLEDRFKLIAHVETREMPIYELVVAKGGPKLTPAKELPRDPNPALPPAPSPGNPPRPADMRQGFMVTPKTSTVMELTAKGQPIEVLAQMPFFGLGSPVVNKTGLTGLYDYTMDWTPDRPGVPATNAPDGQVEADAPSLFTALQEQLGLKLVPTKGPVEVIVIDHIEMPSEN